MPPDLEWLKIWWHGSTAYLERESWVSSGCPDRVHLGNLHRDPRPKVVVFLFAEDMSTSSS